MVTRLIRITIETGTATALVAVINLFLFFGYPDTNYYTVPVMIVAKLYCNTLLVLFNSRMRIAGGREEDLPTTTTIDLPTRSAAVAFSRPPSTYYQDWRPQFRNGKPPSEDAIAGAASSEQRVYVTTDDYVDNKRIERHSKPHALTDDGAV